MLKEVLFSNKEKMPIYKQIAKTISTQIDKGQLKKDYLLPSINVFSEQYTVARDTIERAYKVLKTNGYITGLSGKGYYVLGKVEKKTKILLVFNKLSSFKKIIYYSFLKALGDTAVVDLQVHHYNSIHFKTIIDKSLGQYDYYVIMPHFETNADPKEYLDTIRQIPSDELLLLDKSIPEITNCMAVFQDFRMDIYEALLSASELLVKYNALTILFPEYSNHPPEIIEGLKQFCKEHGKQFTSLCKGENIKLIRGTAYIAIADDDLASVVKKIRKSNYAMGNEIGVISFNETELKELLDITVITTDFEKMGSTAANLILKQQPRQIKNPFKIIKRGSL